MQHNKEKIVQFSCYRIPLATRKKPDAQGLADAAGSGLVAICRKRGGWQGEKSLIFQGLGGAKGRVAVWQRSAATTILALSTRER
jgi:hypothetical protein